MSERTTDCLTARPRRWTQTQAPATAGLSSPGQMYNQDDEQGRNKFTVAQIAAEFGVTRPTIYRYLDNAAEPTPIR